MENIDNKVKDTNVGVSTTSNTSSNPTTTDIRTDVDNIISGLEDLVNNLNDDINNESLLIEEGISDQILSADLTALPMLAIGATGGGLALLISGIKKIAKKKKVKKKYAEVDKLTLQAALLRVQSHNAKQEISNIEDQEKKNKLKDKLEKVDNKAEQLEKLAQDADESVSEALPDDTKFLAALRAETKLKKVKILSKMDGMTDSQKKEIESIQKSAESAIKNAEDSIESKTKDAEEAIEGKDKEEIITNLEDQKRQALENLESAEDSAKEGIQNVIDALDQRIEQLKEDSKGDDSKPKDNNESFNLWDVKYIYENKPTYVSDKFRSLLS